MIDLMIADYFYLNKSGNNNKMNRFLFSSALAVICLTMFASCTTFEERQELLKQALVKELPVESQRVTAVAPAAAIKAGYLVKRSDDNTLENGVFEGQGVVIAYQRISGIRTRVYVHCTPPNKELERTILESIEKELKLD